MPKKVAAKTKPRTPPFGPYPTWTTAKFFGFLRSALRAGYNKWPPKWDVLTAAKREYKGEDKRCKWEYKCSACSCWFKAKQVSVDHIVPAGSLNNFEDLPGFVSRLFCSAEGLQVLCSACHKEKTNAERKAL